MIRRFMILPAALGLICAPTLAHDFWIQPDRFALDEPAVVPVSLFVGHGQDRSRWAVPKEHITRFEVQGPDGTTDRSDALEMGAPAGDARIAFSQPGMHIVTLASRSSFSDLP
ncbi:MAG: hypothetical protein WA908_05400, partial [Pontixanthobacter sp.]